MNFSNNSVRVTLRALFFLTFIVVNVGFGSCSSPKLRTTVLTITRADSTPVEITVEIAESDSERSTGLMHRKALPDGTGMIFVFDRDQQLSFWMKNTIIPLSIAFISTAGTITEIKDMRPLDLNSVKSARSVRYALEVPLGWFDRLGITAGDKVLLNL